MAADAPKPRLRLNLTLDRVAHLILLMAVSLLSALPLMQYLGWSKLAALSATTPLVVQLSNNFVKPYWAAIFRLADTVARRPEEIGDTESAKSGQKRNGESPRQSQHLNGMKTPDRFKNRPLNRPFF